MSLLSLEGLSMVQKGWYMAWLCFLHLRVVDLWLWCFMLVVSLTESRITLEINLWPEILREFVDCNPMKWTWTTQLSLFTVDTIQPPTSYSCLYDFPAMIDWTLGLWAKINLPFLKLFFQVFCHGNKAKLSIGHCGIVVSWWAQTLWWEWRVKTCHPVKTKEKQQQQRTLLTWKIISSKGITFFWYYW